MLPARSRGTVFYALRSSAVSGSVRAARRGKPRRDRGALDDDLNDLPVIGSGADGYDVQLFVVDGISRPHLSVRGVTLEEIIPGVHRPGQSFCTEPG